jgi:glycosyltransferase involved in cell wall biosynthesis
MKVSVIIPTLSEADNILACLHSVKSEQGDYEIIVVDGGSSDGAEEIARSQALVISSKRGRSSNHPCVFSKSFLPPTKSGGIGKVD